MSIALTFDKMSHSDFIDILDYLYKRRISFSFELSDLLMKILIECIDKNKISYFWLSTESMIPVLKELRKYENENVKKLIKDIDFYLDDDFLKILREPTEHFKDYCGDEWLVNGLISQKELVRFIEYHIDLRKIKCVNDTIVTDEWFQSLLKDNRPLLYRHELESLMNSLLL